MFWTNWVRGVNILILFVGIIGSLDIGNRIMNTGDDNLGFIVMAVGVLGTITSVSLNMMISEMSLSLLQINAKLLASTNGYPSFPAANQSSAEPSWICTCGKRNKNTLSSCDNCGKPRQ